MSPIASSFKRQSIGSAKSAKSSDCSGSVNGHPSPLDTTFPLNFQSPSPPPSLMSSTSSGNGYAEMLEDDNMSWGTRKPSNPRPKHSIRSNLRFF